jgi:hypothetical protein
MLLRSGFLAALLVAVMPASANSIQIEINTSALGINGQNWDLAFDLTKGNLDPLQQNSATISGFAITGGSLTGNPTFWGNSGNVTGNLSVAPGVVTLNTYDPVDQSFFNEYTHNANLGSLITFDLVLTANTTSGLDPDTFSFFFLDPDSGLPLDTADPTGALFIYSIGNDNQPQTFCVTTAPCVTATPIEQAVPEPGALALALAALLALGIPRAFRRVPLRRVPAA